MKADVATARPLIMGIVNVTPDSFSDGGLFLNPHDAIAHGLRLVEEGADILDIGAESTRPGAAPVETQEELDRVLPVIEGLRARVATPLSIDTMKPAVARAAFHAGAGVWNDVNGLRDREAMQAALALKAEVIVMHMQGAPRTMQEAPHYLDVVEEVAAFLEGQVRTLRAGGVNHAWIDPGIGFGKTLAHNLALMRAIPVLKARCNARLVFGASRKSFIAKIESRDGANSSSIQGRLGGSIAAVLAAARWGADMVRVHDVAETLQALRVAAALEQAALA